MANVRQRTQREVMGLLEAIVHDAEPLVPQVPETYSQWRAQMDEMDAWQAVVLSNVADLLPDGVRALVLRFTEMRDTVLFRDLSQVL